MKTIPVSHIFCGSTQLYVAERAYVDGVDYYTLTPKPAGKTLILTTNERAASIHKHILVYGKDSMSLAILYGTRDEVEFKMRRLAFSQGVYRVDLEACEKPWWRKEFPVELKNFPAECAASKKGRKN